jgi:hypothetical protein
MDLVGSGFYRGVVLADVLHELVLQVVTMPIEYDEQGHNGQIVKALLGEID